MTLTNQYAEAIIKSALSTDVETVLPRIRAVLEKHGHGKLLESILRRVVILSQEKEKSVEFKVTKKNDTEHYREELKRYGLTVPEDVVMVDESLIGGFFYRDGQRLLDRSYKRALINLYKEITQ